MSVEIEFSCGHIQHYPKDELRNFQYFRALFCSGMKDAEKLGILSKVYITKKDLQKFIHGEFLILKNPVQGVVSN